MVLSVVRVLFVSTVVLRAVDGYTGLFVSTQQCPPGPWWNVTWTNIPNIRNRDLLKDINKVDVNMDDVITLEEMMNLSNWGIDVAPPITRCQFVRIETYRYGIYNDVASRLFDVIDVDHDKQLTETDFRSTFSSNLHSMDDSGEGQLSVCELYRGIVDYVREADAAVHERYMKSREIIRKADNEIFS